MANERSATTKGVAALPLLLMSLIHLTVSPLREMFRIEPLLMYAWYTLAIVLGLILWRKSSTIKDHEYHRSQVMKKMKKVYQAEEEGVWQSNAALGSELSAEAQLKLRGQVSSIDGEAPEMTLGEDERVDVTMLMDAAHIQKANRRVSGTETFGEQGIDSTIGAVRKKSPMDSFLDSMFGLFGRRDAEERRHSTRKARLEAAAQAAPVMAQRPVAPIRAAGTTEDTTLQVTSVSDGGGVDSMVTAAGEAIEDSRPMTESEKVYAWDKPQQSQHSTSIEAMAMLSTPVKATTPVVQQRVAEGTQCKGCKKQVPPGERFCPHCGLDV